MKIGVNKKTLRKSFLMFAVFLSSVSLLDFVGAQLFNLKPVNKIKWNLDSIIKIFSVWILLGFAEEISFRGYIQSKLKSLGKWKGIILSALIFALWHVPGSLVSGNFGSSTIIGVLIFTIFSVVFFNIPYDYTGMLPFLALFHGWNDFPFTLSLNYPNIIGVISGYLVYLMIIFFYWKNEK